MGVMICILPYIVEYKKQYHPYPANDGKHKYYIITKSGRKFLFGAIGYEHFYQDTGMRTGNSDI
jgi:hypothetical protein